MQPSPIQLKQLFYRHIAINSPNEEDDTLNAVDFDFAGVEIHDESEVKILESAEENQPTIYLVTLRIGISNEKGKICPYSIDMETAGFFESLISGMPKEKQIEFVQINGCAILYSVIRDYVMNFTGRCLRGTLILPTVNFLDRRIPETNNSSNKEPMKRKRKKIIKQADNIPT